MPKPRHGDADETRSIAPQTVERRPRTDTAPASRKPAAARLVCVAGLDRGRSFPVGPEPLVFGRGSSSQTDLLAIDISRRHTRIAMRGDEITIEDLGSRNGTYVNGERIAGVVPLHVGARVQLGDSSIFVLTRHDELEASMRQLQKLEAMEQVVCGVAHEFKNALTVIGAGLDYALEKVTDASPELREVLADVKVATSGAAELARRLMHYRERDGARPQDLLVVSALVDDALALVRHTLDRSIALEVAVAPDLMLRGARDELQQVLVNLALNARDAMPTGGTISIVARRVELERAEATARQLAAAGPFVQLVVADTGAGMSEEILAHAFEPFFTTKPAGQGTGLGLSIVHNIIRAHGGAIELDSAPGEGTTFQIWLPLAV